MYDLIEESPYVLYKKVLCVKIWFSAPEGLGTFVVRFVLNVND
jgi:hypothetical protein